MNSHPSSLDEVMRPCQGSDVSIGKDVKYSEFYVCKYSRVSDALLMMFVVADTSIFRPHFFCSPTAHLLMHDGIMNAMIWGINTTPETARQEVFIHIKRAEREKGYRISRHHFVQIGLVTHQKQITGHAWTMHGNAHD